MLILLRQCRWRETFPYLAIIAVGVLVALIRHYFQTHNYAANVTPYNESNDLFIGIPSEGWTAIFTGVLTVSTIGLWWVTYKQGRLGQQEFVATHRPRIVVQQIKSAMCGSFRNDKSAYVEIVMANAGEAVATIHDWNARLYFRHEHSALVPFLNVIPITVSENGFDVPPGGLKTVAAKHREMEDEHAEFVNGRADMFVAGTVLYSGPDGIKRRMGFCRKWDGTYGSWQPLDNSEYEYAY